MDTDSTISVEGWSEISPLDHRLTLVRAALQDTPEFELSQVDILRSPPYYAVDTVRILQKEFPGAELIYLMGGDSLEDLPQWHKPQEFVQEIAGLGIYKRPGAEPDLKSLDKQFPGLGDKTTFFHSPRIEISAADIRRRIHERRPYRFFLLPAVYQVIQSHQYYW